MKWVEPERSPGRHVAEQAAEESDQPEHRELSAQRRQERRRSRAVAVRQSRNYAKTVMGAESDQRDQAGDFGENDKTVVRAQRSDRRNEDERLHDPGGREHDDRPQRDRRHTTASREKRAASFRSRTTSHNSPPIHAASAKRCSAFAGTAIVGSNANECPTAELRGSATPTTPSARPGRRASASAHSGGKASSARHSSTRPTLVPNAEAIHPGSM